MSGAPDPPFGAVPQQSPPAYGYPGYGAPAYGAPAGGYQGYGYGGLPQQEHPQGTIVLILGILGLVTCQVLSPIAWAMGNRALAEIDAAPGRYGNRSVVNIGRICGIVGCVLLGLGAAFFLLYLVLAIGLVASTGA